MPTSPDNPITIDDLFSAKDNARLVNQDEIEWITNGPGMRVRVGEQEMRVVVIDDPNFSNAFVAPIRGQNYLVSPALM